MSLPVAAALVPLVQFPAVPGIIGALIVAAVVLLVGRILMSVAWKVVIVALVVAVVLWFLGLLGPLASFFA